jgi:hypothetical protein
MQLGGQQDILPGHGALRRSRPRRVSHRMAYRPGQQAYRAEACRCPSSGVSTRPAAAQGCESSSGHPATSRLPLAKLTEPGRNP